jgi:hypothetical protein
MCHFFGNSVMNCVSPIKYIFSGLPLPWINDFPLQIYWQLPLAKTVKYIKIRLYWL